MEQLVIQKNRTCGGCYLENNNRCYWFVKRNNQSKPKYIPADVFSKACSKYELNIDIIEESELLSKLIDVFDGEIIGNKFTPTKKKTYIAKLIKRKNGGSRNQNTNIQKERIGEIDGY